MARFVIDYGLLRGPLCDLFECVISWLRVTCLDVNVCALTCYHVMNWCVQWPLHDLLVHVSLLDHRMTC